MATTYIDLFCFAFTCSALQAEQSLEHTRQTMTINQWLVDS